MTLKEKAKELVYNTFWLDGMDFENSKQCALTAVDEIINTFIDIDPKKVYWQEVKQEIEKL